MQSAAAIHVALSPHRDSAKSTYDIDRVVCQLRQIKRTSTMALAIDVGHLVIEHIFGGDAASARDGRSHPGFRKLARHPKLPFTKSTLWRYVRIYHVVRCMPGLARQANITVAHLTAVLGLDTDRQERLLKRAVTEHWSARQLAHEVEHLTGRPASASHARMLKTLRRLEQLPSTLPMFGKVDTLAPEERVRIRKVVEGTRAWCEAVGCWLEAGVTHH